MPESNRKSKTLLQYARVAARWVGDGILLCFGATLFSFGIITVLNLVNSVTTGIGVVGYFDASPIKIFLLAGALGALNLFMGYGILMRKRFMLEASGVSWVLVSFANILRFTGVIPGRPETESMWPTLLFGLLFLTLWIRKPHLTGGAWRPPQTILFAVAIMAVLLLEELTFCTQACLW